MIAKIIPIVILILGPNGFSFESVYEKSEPKQITISSFVEIPTHSFLISTDAGRVDMNQVSQRIQYNPTFGPNIGISAKFNFWSLSLSKKLSFLNQDDIQKYGKTIYYDFRFGYHFTNEFLIETYYQNYNGFYTDLTGQEGLQTSFGGNNNGKNSKNSKSPSQIISRPDITSVNYGLRANYSIPLVPFFKLFTFDQKEKDSIDFDFNFLTKAFYNRLSIIGSNPLVPAATSDSFSPIASLKEFSSNTLGVGVGLGVIIPGSRKFTFGFDGIVGSGFQRQVRVSKENELVAYTTSEELNANLYMDWRGDINKLRFGFYWDSLSSKVKDINFDSTNVGINFTWATSVGI